MSSIYRTSRIVHLVNRETKLLLALIKTGAERTVAIERGDGLQNSILQIREHRINAIMDRLTDRIMVERLLRESSISSSLIMGVGN